MPLVNGVIEHTEVNKVVKQKDDEKIKVEKEDELRSVVFRAILALTDTVTEDELLNVLPTLDTKSWDGVVEERFISGVCGWPLCAHHITVGKIRKFKMDRKLGKVFEHYATREKYCSPHCFNCSECLRPQLSDVPFYLTGEPNVKSYNLTPSSANNGSIRAVSSNDSKNTEKQIEFVPDNLIASMKNLFIAENALSGSESDEDGDESGDAENTGKKELSVDDRQFLEGVKSFITCRTSAPTNCDPSNASQTHVMSNAIKPVKAVGPSAEEAEAKLAKLRLKFGKCPKVKKPPIFVEPHHEASMKVNSIKLDARKHAEAVIDLLKIWITPDTIHFIRTDAKPREPTEGEAICKQFFESVLDPRHASKIFEKQLEAESVKLPLVDKVDQHFRRVDIVMNAIMKPWTSYVFRLKIDASSGQCQKLVATFNLTRDNVVVDPRCLNVLAIALFHLLICSNPELRALAEQNDTLKRHENIMASYSIEPDFFATRLKAIIAEKLECSDISEE